MKRSQAKASPRTRTARAPRRARSLDAQVAEFEARDLGRDIRASGVRPRVLGRRGKPTSLYLDEELIAQLRKKGEVRGLGYQTMLKMIVREHLDEY